MESKRAQALLIVSHGAPERPDDVPAFLQRLFGRKPAETVVEEVVQRYRCVGKSPFADQMRTLVTQTTQLLATQGPTLQVFWGNLFWKPFLEDALAAIVQAGIRESFLFVAGAFGSAASCGRAILSAERLATVLGVSLYPTRLFFNHPLFIEAVCQRIAEAIEDSGYTAEDFEQVIFTAHSLPKSLADRSPYELHLQEACRLVAERLGVRQWVLTFQSRGLGSQQQWLEPELTCAVEQLVRDFHVRRLLVVPIGFFCEHMETIYNLDVLLADQCKSLGVEMIRARAVGPHEKIVSMIRELVVEQLDPNCTPRALGNLGPWPLCCPASCCESRLVH